MEKSEKIKKRFLKLTARQAGSELSSLGEAGGSHSSLSYFYDVLEKVFISNEPEDILNYESDKKPVIGIYCILVPEELIYAAGAVPVRLCAGCYDASQLSEDFLPRDSCPLVKSSMGLSVQSGLKIFDICDVVIIPTTCDSKRKLGEELSAYKNVWMLEVPHIKDAEFSKRIWIEQIWALKSKLEKFSTSDGRKCVKIKPRRLKKSIQDIAHAQHEMRRLLDIRKSKVPVISGKQATAVVNSYAYAPVTEWTKALNRLNNELYAKYGDEKMTGKDKPRIFIAGSPMIFPNLKIPGLVEDMGGVVVIDESCAGDRYIYDPVGSFEYSMKEQVTAIASRYMAPCICPSFAPNDDRLLMIRRLAEDYAVDGVLYHVLKGCIIYDFEIRRVEQELKEMGIPLLRIETDYNPEDLEQLRTRVEAFIEMLRAMKKRNNRKDDKNEKVLCRN